MFKRTSIIIGLIIFCLVFTPIYCLAKTQKIGILPYYESDRIWSYYKPFIKYLNKQTGLSWELRLYPSYEKIINAICRDEISVAYLGPVPFGLANKKCGVKPIVVALSEDEKPFYRSVIFTSNKQISSIKDLRHKRFAFGNKKSTSSYIIPRKMLEDEGVGMKDIKPIVLKDHERIIEAVINNNAEAGAVKDSVFKRFKTFNLKIIKKSEPILHHTFCVSKKIDTKAEKTLQKVLLKLKPLKNKSDKEITKKWDPELKYGFTLPPEDYIKEVDKLLRLYKKYN